MAFDQSFFSPVGAVSSASPTIYSYQSTDTVSQVMGADYFDAKKFQLEVGDLIYISASSENETIIYQGEGNPSIPAGDGMGLDGAIEVNSLANLPPDTADVIQLEDNTTYVFAPAGIDMGNKRLVAGVNNAILGLSPSQNAINYTGTDPFITANDFDALRLEGVKINSPNATVLDLSGDGLFTLNNVRTTFCDHFAHFDECGFVVLDAEIICNTGITCAGSNLRIGSVERVFLQSTTSGTLFDMGTATFDIFELLKVAYVTGGIAFKGLANSGNMPTGVVANIAGGDFQFATTPLDGVTESDIQLEFQSNTGLSGSTKVSESSLTGATTATIVSAGVFIAVDGATPSWVTNADERFDVSTSGLHTYVGIPNINISAIGRGVYDKNNVNIRLKIFKNGIAPANDRTLGAAKDVQVNTIVSDGIFTMVTGDTLQLFHANMDGTSDLDMLTASLSVVNGF